MIPTQADIQQVADRIVAACRPERVILFGSRCYGEPRPDSDVDLLVILPFEGTPYRKAIEVYAAARAAFPIDIVVRRPEAARQGLENGDPVIREAMTRGRVLYERAA